MKARAARSGAAAVFYWDLIADTEMDRYLRTIEERFVRRHVDAMGALPVDLALDVAAGSGRHTAYLATIAREVVATEINAQLLAGLAGIGPNVRAVPVTAEEQGLPAPDQTAAIILCLEAPDVSQQAWFFEECRRVLQPDGRVILTLQNRLSWKGLVAAVMPHRYTSKQGPAYYHVSYRHYLRWARELGFEAVEVQGFNWLPFSRASNSKSIPWLARLESFLARLPGALSLSPWIIASFRLSGAKEE